MATYKVTISVEVEAENEDEAAEEAASEFATWDSEDFVNGSDSIEPVCGQCLGHGWLLDQEYGFTDLPRNAIPIQRCDTCARFEGDEDAAKAAAKFYGTTYGKPAGFESSEDPLDVWIIGTEDVLAACR